MCFLVTCFLNNTMLIPCSLKFTYYEIKYYNKWIFVSYLISNLFQFDKRNHEFLPTQTLIYNMCVCIMYGKEICLIGPIKYIDEQHNREKGIKSNNFKRSNRNKFSIVNTILE